MKFIVRLFISTLAIVVTAYLLRGVKIDSFSTAIVVAAVLAFLNTIVKPVMILFTIPITILTLGLFLIVINSLMILLTAKIVHGFEVQGFWSAMIFSIILSLVTSIFDAISKEKV